MTIHQSVHAFRSDKARTPAEIRLVRSPDPSPYPPLLQALDTLDQGLVMTTSASRIVYANPAAQRILARYALTSKDGQISGSTCKATRELRVIIADVALGSRSRVFYRLAGSGANQCLLLTIVAARSSPDGHCDDEPRALVFVGESRPAETPPSEMMRAFFDLTPAEARMAAEMIKGDGVKACAQRLGVTPSTARTHLKHVFDKTGTRRQAELAVLLLGCCPLTTGGQAAQEGASSLKKQQALPTPRA